MKKFRFLKQQRQRMIYVIPSTESVRKTASWMVGRLKRLGYQTILSKNGTAPVIGTAAVVLILDCEDAGSLLNESMLLHDTPVLLVRNATKKVERWMIRGIVEQNCITISGKKQDLIKATDMLNAFFPTFFNLFIINLILFLPMARFFIKRKVLGQKH